MRGAVVAGRLRFAAAKTLIGSRERVRIRAQVSR